MAKHYEIVEGSVTILTEIMSIYQIKHERECFILIGTSKGCRAGTCKRVIWWKCQGLSLLQTWKWWKKKRLTFLNLGIRRTSAAALPPMLTHGWIECKKTEMGTVNFVKFTGDSKVFFQTGLLISWCNVLVKLKHYERKPGNSFHLIFVSVFESECQTIPWGGWARTTVYVLWVMGERCFVASLINLNLITVDVGVRCVHILCTRRGQKYLKNWGDMFRLLEMSNCNDFCHSSCQTFELQCGWSRGMRDAQKCEKFGKILRQSVLGSLKICVPCGILLV